MRCSRDIDRAQCLVPVSSIIRVLECRSTNWLANIAFRCSCPLAGHLDADIMLLESFLIAKNHGQIFVHVIQPLRRYLAPPGSTFGTAFCMTKATLVSFPDPPHAPRRKSLGTRLGGTHLEGVQSWQALPRHLYVALQGICK